MRFPVTFLAVCLVWIVSIPPGAETVLRMSPSSDTFDYYPTDSQVRSETNPYPRKNIRVLADRWEALHPGIRIELVRVPRELAYRAWCVSNFMAGTIPHIIYQNMGLVRDNDFQKGWVIPVDEHLEKSNPYVPGNTRWNDLFYPVWQDAMRSLDGKLYWVAPDTVGVGLLCNLDILEEAGVTSLPKTFGELIAACEKVKQAGYMVYHPGDMLFIDCVLASAIWGELIPQMDVLRKDGIIDVQEMARAVEKGILRTDDGRLRELFRLAKELMNYFVPGYLSVDRMYAFLQGKLAFFEALSFYMRQVEDDTRRNFRYTVIPFPEISPEDSPFGGYPLAGAGNAGCTTTWQVTNTAVRDGVVDLCIDWLMYLTTPENAEFLVNEVGFTIPGVKGAKPLPLYEPLMEAALEKMQSPRYLDWHALVLSVYSTEFFDTMRRIREDLCHDTITIDEAVENTDFWLRRTHRHVMRRNTATWDLSKW
ncbi:MAG TPA: ABC transporter substrate-binding protein [bacterium]|nr:ABC transporter substrate-binding protein [bacterium]HQO35787.1 ABC transporter substrate-binding protein [bacterium]HQP97078.1 ABC transporter substrate-binding protein [bacterium]